MAMTATAVGTPPELKGEVDVPSFALAAEMWERAREAGSSVFSYVRDAGDSSGWREIPWTQFAEDVASVAKSLVATGIERGDRVGLLANTRYEWTYVDYAILSLGAITVPIYQTSSAEEIEYILNDSGARLLVLEDAEQAEKVLKSGDGIPGIESIVQIEGELPADSRWQSFADFKAKGDGIDEAEVKDRAAQVDPTDVATYIYTSGTTGPPKGCIITNRNFMFAMRAVQGAVPGLFNPEESTLLFLPLAHGFARMIQFIAVDTGLRLYYGSVRELSDELKTARPTFFISVPRMFEKAYAGVQSKANKSPVGRIVFDLARKVSEPISLANQDGKGLPIHLKLAQIVVDKLIYSKVREGLGGNVRMAVSGGSKLSADVAHFFNAAGIPILEGYGLTETSPVSTVNAPDGYRIGTVGRRLPGVELKIADDGEILIRGDNIFQGYYNDEAKTEEALAGGWFHSGDIGKIDADGFLHITGRIKDLIITAGGKNIGPAFIEDKIKESHYISQAVLIGDNKPYLVALITVDPDETKGMSPEAIHAEVEAAINRANSVVGRVEQVKKFTILDHDFTVESGEITPTMKVKRNVVADHHAKAIESMYAK